MILSGGADGCWVNNAARDAHCTWPFGRQCRGRGLRPGEGGRWGGRGAVSSLHNRLEWLHFDAPAVWLCVCGLIGWEGGGWGSGEGGLSWRQQEWVAGLKVGKQDAGSRHQEGGEQRLCGRDRRQGHMQGHMVRTHGKDT